MGKRYYYCGTCGQSFRAESQLAIDHNHLKEGIAENFMLYKPALLESTFAHAGVKPIYGGKRWRAGWIQIETGYSETPSWGHEAGGWIHYEYEAMKDFDGDYIEAPTEAELIAKLRVLPSLRPSSYFAPSRRQKNGTRT